MDYYFSCVGRASYGRFLKAKMRAVRWLWKKQITLGPVRTWRFQEFMKSADIMVCRFLNP